MGYKSDNAFLDVIGEYEPTKKSLPVFNAIFEGRRPRDGEKAETDQDMILRDGPSYGLDYYPNPFTDFIDSINSKLAFFGRSVTSIIRWRYAQEGGPSPIGSRGLFCFNEQSNCWVILPPRTSLLSITPPHSILNPREVDVEEILNLVEMNKSEPIAHELLREAKELRHTSPRSAVLIAVSAAEVAIKSVVVERVPDATWLIESNQAPPIVEILTKYFPALFLDEELFYKPTRKEGIVKTIFDAVYIRNQMAHKGAAAPDPDKVSSILMDIEKLVWGCDYLSGYKWALEYVSQAEGGDMQ